jgi:hypothetical protein
LRRRPPSGRSHGTTPASWPSSRTANLGLARSATTRRASAARGGSFHGRRCGARSGTRWLREGRACLPREPYPREPVVRPGRTDSTGGTGHRIVSARSFPSASGLRCAAHCDARKRQSSQSVKEEERRACARYFRWPPFPAGQPPVRAGSPAHHGLRARGGRRSAPRAGHARSRDERSPSLLAITPPAWPGSPRTPRTPVSPKFAQLTPGAPRHLAPVPGRSEWAPRLQGQGYPLGRILDAVY